MRQAKTTVFHECFSNEEKHYFLLFLLICSAFLQCFPLFLWIVLLNFHFHVHLILCQSRNQVGDKSDWVCPWLFVCKCDMLHMTNSLRMARNLKKIKTVPSTFVELKKTRCRKVSSQALCNRKIKTKDLA